MSTHVSLGITRNQAFELLKTHLQNERLVGHCIATEAIMRKMAVHFGEDPELWGIAGLLHDLDYEITGENESLHGLKTEEILKELFAKSISPVIIDVIKKHNAEGLKLKRETVFEHALTCAESVTGLIVATALVYPDKKIAGMKVKSVTKRMKTPHFARAVSRERIMECEKTGLDLDTFIGMSIDAMTEIADQIGL